MIINKRQIKNLFLKMGFVVEGNFLIGNINSDIISGFALDFTPSMSTVWNFILPSFDDLDFFHMSLGERVIYLDDESRYLGSVINEEWHKFSGVLSASNLLDYLESFDEKNNYANWCKLLCFIRIDRFQMADYQMEVVERNPAPVIFRKLEILKDSIKREGWNGAQDVLNRWSEKTCSLVKKQPLVIPSG